MTLPPRWLVTASTRDERDAADRLLLWRLARQLRSNGTPQGGAALQAIRPAGTARVFDMPPSSGG